MNYSPKLKKVISEIEKILKENDVAGMVVVHTPGNTEYLLKLDASYSAATVEANQKIRVKAMMSEFPTKEDWVRKVTDTSNMLSMISEAAGLITLSVMDLSTQLDKTVNAEHTKTRHTGDNEITN